MVAGFTNADGLPTGGRASTGDFRALLSVRGNGVQQERYEWLDEKLAKQRAAVAVDVDRDQEVRELKLQAEADLQAFRVFPAPLVNDLTADGTRIPAGPEDGRRPYKTTSAEAERVAVVENFKRQQKIIRGSIDAGSAKAGDTARLQASVLARLSKEIAVRTLPQHQPTPVLQKGEGYQDFAQRQAANVSTFKAESDATELSVLPKDETLALLRPDFEAKLSSGARPRLTIAVPQKIGGRIFRSAPHIAWPKTAAGGDLGRFALIDIEKVLTWAVGEQLWDEYVADAEEFYATPGLIVLSAEQRKARLAELRAKISEAEHLEAEALHLLRAQGVDVTFRPDLHPSAFLGIAD